MENKPKYTIVSSEKDGILEIVLTGEVDKEGVGALQNEVITLVMSRDTKALLVDVSGLKGRFGYMEAYDRVRNYPADIPRLHTAIVDIAENADYENFHETTAYNVGLSYKWFTDVQEARAWLIKKMK